MYLTLDCAPGEAKMRRRRIFAIDFRVEFEIQGKLDLAGMNAKKKRNSLAPYQIGANFVNFSFQNTRTHNC